MLDYTRLSMGKMIKWFFDLFGIQVTWNLEGEKMKKGDVVLFVCHFDSDTEETPNINPATVTKVQRDGSLDLVVHSINGVYFKAGVNGSDDKTARGTWHEVE